MGNNEALASALEKLGKYSGRLPMNANPSTAHMFIVNPLSGQRMMSLFSTHPPLEERIAKLRGIQPVKHVSDHHGKRRVDKGRDNGRNQGRQFWKRLSGK
jgi:heat shock protein HtpX